jgi:hypothetical protein
MLKTSFTLKLTAMNYQPVFTLLMALLFAVQSFAHQGPGNELLKNAENSVVDATQQSSSPCNVAPDSKISVQISQYDARNVVITFTLDDDNKIHVLDVQGGYNFLNHYIKSSLEGKEIHADNAIPGINYVMTVKLPASA